jgi:membrane protein implicated in regulation of membrane protease activity
VDSPETWRWIWLVASAVFLLGEMATAASFFMLPFAIGAAVAAVLAFLDVSVAWEWAAFVVVSLVALAALWPLRRRLDRAEPVDGIGARRLLNQQGVVQVEVPAGPDGSGMALIGREEWRAQSHDATRIASGTHVVVLAVRGTAVVVRPVDSHTSEDLS